MNNFRRIAALLLIGMFPVHFSAADQKISLPGAGMAALNAVADQSLPGKEIEILGMVGFYGDPDPAQWLVLTQKVDSKGPLLELVVRDNKVLAKRKVRKNGSMDIPSIPIQLSKIKINSVAARGIAEELAKKSQIDFETIHYQLRCRDEGNEPVWNLNLIDQNQVSVGVHYISALTGKILRSVWHLESPEQNLSQVVSENFDGRRVRMVRPIERKPEL